MKITGYYVKKEFNKNCKLVVEKSKKNIRPAWIEVKGLPRDTNFIQVHLGKSGKKGRRIQFYKTYLPEGLFIPIDFTQNDQILY